MFHSFCVLTPKVRNWGGKIQKGWRICDSSPEALQVHAHQVCQVYQIHPGRSKKQKLGHLMRIKRLQHC